MIVQFVPNNFLVNIAGPAGAPLVSLCGQWWLIKSRRTILAENPDRRRLVGGLHRKPRHVHLGRQIIKCVSIKVKHFFPKVVEAVMRKTI